VNDLSRLLPKEAEGWKASGADAVYNRQTIFDYLDGGAEVYLAFDFRELLVRKFRNRAGAEIALDIYDMGSPAEAFGAFSCDRQDPEAGVGQASEYGPGLLRLWQGRYFVSLTAAGGESEAEPALRALAKAAASALGPPGELPLLLQALPPAGLKKDRSCYFHSLVNLNNRFFVAAENILGLGAGTDGVLAEYDLGGGEPARLLLIRYPDEKAAAAAERSFAGRPGDAPAAASLRRGDLLITVFGAPTKDAAARLMSAVGQPRK